MCEITDGFYEAHLRDMTLFCYVHRTKEGVVLADLPDGQTWPVTETGRWPSYIRPSLLRPTDPKEHTDKALGLIKFIFTHLIELEKARANESSLVTS